MTEPTMIDRVARALALADLDPESRRAVNLDAHMAHVRGHYGELARAAIEAMREPTDVMRNAGGVQGYGHTREQAEEWAKEEKFDSYAEESADYWRSMIDAALSEG